MKIKRVVTLLRHRPATETVTSKIVHQIRQDYEIEVEDEWWELSDEIPPFLKQNEADQMAAHRRELTDSACFLTVWFRME